MGWKWKKWKDMIPYSSCLCFGRKQWQPIVDDDEEAASRRGGISFEKTDNNALYVRMLGDVKVQTTPVISRERRRSSLLDSDLRILESLDVSQYKIRYGHKFYSLHRVKRKTRSALKGTHDDAILDDHYGGQARCLLSTVGDWSFNVFNLDKLTNGRSLFHMALHIFQEYNLVDTFQLDIVKLMRCFTLIEEGYHSNNHYHNAVHAADVGQAMHCYLKESKLAACVTPLETMVAIISALAHDLDHPGVNQTFLISTSNHLAALYKNSSVLENHHWRSAMGVIHESGIFSHLDQQTFSVIESQIRSLILATDITRQQELLGQFKKLLETNELDLEDEAHRNFTLQIALKCADICNPCRPWDISKRWSEQICDEFFQQGDYERQLQLPVTPNCDRYNTTVAKIQSGFIQFVVSPLFNEWYHFNPTPLSQTMLANMRHNKALWDSITAKSEAEQKYACQEGCSSEEENQDPIDPTFKENININVNVHCEDVPEEEVVLEDRFDSSCNSEDFLFKGCSLRRHSLPPPVIHRDFQQAFPRRESLTNKRLPSQSSYSSSCKSSRRHSLPVSSNSHNTSALDRLAEKLVSLAEKGQQIDNISGFEPRTAVSEILSQRPKITNLSSDSDATFRLSSLNALLAARAAGNQGTLLAGRLTSRLKTHANKEVTFDIACPAHTAKANVLRTTSCPGGGILQTRSTGGNGNNNSRQVLKPLNTNNYQPPGAKLEGTPRNRSGSDFGLRSKQLQGVLFERPRSLSLEHESQPLLRSIGEWRALSAERNDIQDGSSVYTAQPSSAYNEADIDVAMATGHVMEEEAMTMPLLGDHRTHHSSHSTSSSHLSPS